MNRVSVFTEDILISKSLEAAVTSAIGVNATLVKSPVTDGLACSQRGVMISENVLANAWWIAFSGSKNDIPEFLSDCIKRKMNKNEDVPDCLIVQNVGLFILGCNDQAVKKIPPIFYRLGEFFSAHRLSEKLPSSTSSRSIDVELEIKALFGLEAGCLASVGIFSYAQCGTTLRHDTLIGSAPFSAPLTIDNARYYMELHGHLPRIVVADDRVYGLGFAEEEAIYRLALSMESALALHLADLFGRIESLSKCQQTPATSAA